MREDDQTKEELHQRTDILSDELWEIAEDRKEQAIEERKMIMESGWVEFQLEYFSTCAQHMMQSEIDKFKATIQLVHDYYHAVDDKLIPEAPETNHVDLLKEDTELPEVEKIAEGAEIMDINSYSYPRLDDLFKRALKAQIVPDVATGTADTGKKGAKGGKDAKGKPAEDDKPKAESIYVSEMREAIKVEKSILRFRLSQIRNWALKRLQYQRNLSLKIYQKLEDWIHVSNKAENDAIDQIADVIKDAIESEDKVQVELRINYMDFLVDHKIHNFIIPPPDVLAAMEEDIPTRFNIPQLNSLIQELAMLSGDNDLIANREAVNMLVRKVKNSSSFCDVGGLPKSWSQLTQTDFERMIRNLDPSNSGSINYKQFGTICILLQSGLPTSEDMEVMKKNLQQPEVSSNCFLSEKLWFEKTEAQKDRNNSHAFPRVDKIKELLFDLHKGENGTINMPKFTKTLMVGELRSIMANETKTSKYEDFVVAKL